MSNCVFVLVGNQSNWRCKVILLHACPDIETGADNRRALLDIRDLNWGMARWRLGQLPASEN
jgi:hypothetical protein